MQSVVRILFPPQCISCDALVETEFQLCSECWLDTHFITGLTCEQCGASLPGEVSEQDVQCDSCLMMPRPWQYGQAALNYRGNGKRMVLALKHGDRIDLANPAAQWMVDRIAPYIQPGTIAVPTPVHWTRLLSRQYNQAAVLAAKIAKILSVEFQPDALIRNRRTKVHENMSHDERFENMLDAIEPHPKYGAKLRGRPVLLVDDVMTSGATFSAAAQACKATGTDQISVIALARVAKDA